MNAAAQPHDTLLPKPPGGRALGAALSLGIHGLLLLALATAVRWHRQTPDVVSAELWSSLPQAAAPTPVAATPPPEPQPAPQPAPPPPPPPRAAAPAEAPPPKVDIATERAEQARLERERHEAEAARRRRELARAEAERKEKLHRQQLQHERAEQAAREARERKEAQARVEQQRQDALRRMQDQAATAGNGAAPSAGAAARSAGPSAGYTARLVALIRPNIVFTDDVPGNPVAEVRVTTAASGTIIASRLVKPSGNAAWDDAVLRAIDKTGRLPRDADGSVPPELIVRFRPKE